MRPHGHFNENFEKNSNVVRKFSDNEARDCKPLKNVVIINFRNPLVHIITFFGVGAYSRLGALKVLFQGGVVGVGAYSRLGAY